MSQYVEVANQVLILKERGWVEKHGFWSHPQKTYPHFTSGAKGPKIENQVYLFTFQQAIKAEGLE